MKNKYLKLDLILLFLSLQSITIFAQEFRFDYGAIKLNDSTFIDQCETSIGSWLTYYTWTLENVGYDAAQKIMPDSSAIEPEIWTCINSKSDVYNNGWANTGQHIGYFKYYCHCLNSDKFFLMFPITGLTYEQVIGYCNWRTKIVGKNKIIYRLPTPDEWKKIVIVGMSSDGKMENYVDSLDKKKCPSYNYKVNYQCNKKVNVSRLNRQAMFIPDKNSVMIFWVMYLR